MATLTVGTSSAVTANNIRVDLFLYATNALIAQGTPVASVSGVVPAHQFLFTNLLPQTVYYYRVFEVNGSNVIQFQRGEDTFVTIPAAGSYRSYDPVDIVADYDPNFTSGTNTFTMDGTNGSPDWRGRELDVNNPGFGFMFKGNTGDDQGYTWNSNTGTFTATHTDFLFAPSQRLHVLFLPKQIASPVTLRERFSGVLLVTDDISLTTADAEKIIDVQGDVPSLTISLPPIAGFFDLIGFTFQFGKGNHKNATVASVDGANIEYLNANKAYIHSCNCESFYLFRKNNVWSITNADGNYKTVGEMVIADTEPSDAYNMYELDGGECDVNEDARLYEWISTLPAPQLVTYDSWSINQTKWSTANGSGKFRRPNRAGLVAKSVSGSRVVGDYEQDQLKETSFQIPKDSRPGLSDNANDRDVMIPGGNGATFDVLIGTGDEMRVKNFSTRIYVRR
jgi:hypothetical protein